MIQAQYQFESQVYIQTDTVADIQKYYLEQPDRNYFLQCLIKYDTILEKQEAQIQYHPDMPPL